MRTSRWLSALILAGFALATAAPASAQGVAKRTAKRAAKDATKDAAGDAAKKAAANAMAPDAIDLNAATPEQLAKLGLDEATAKKVVASRPFTSLEDPKLTEAIPADTLAKLKGKVTVKPAGDAKPADAAAPADPAAPPSVASPTEPATPATPATPPPQSI
jgi:DNA uptake protein ComE-like DNA-binding protein